MKNSIKVFIQRLNTNKQFHDVLTILCLLLNHLSYDRIEKGELDFADMRDDDLQMRGLILTGGSAVFIY